MKTSSLILIPLVAVLSMSSSCDKDGEIKKKNDPQFSTREVTANPNGEVIRITSKKTFNWVEICELDETFNEIPGTARQEEVLGLYDKNNPESKKWGVKLDWIQAEYLNLYEGKWYGTGMKITVTPNNTPEQRICVIIAGMNQYDSVGVRVIQPASSAGQDTSQEE